MSLTKEEALTILAFRKKVQADKENGIIDVRYTHFIKSLKTGLEVGFFDYICIYYCCHCTGWNITERDRAISLEQIEENLFNSITPDILDQLRKMGLEGINEEIHKFDHWLYQDDVRLNRLAYIVNKLLQLMAK